jgi:hypothetical protein
VKVFKDNTALRGGLEQCGQNKRPLTFITGQSLGFALSALWALLNLPQA